jgi:hypothetical protein
VVGWPRTVVLPGARWAGSLRTLAGLPPYRYDSFLVRPRSPARLTLRGEQRPPPQHLRRLDRTPAPAGLQPAPDRLPQHASEEVDGLDACRGRRLPGSKHPGQSRPGATDAGSRPRPRTAW